MQRRWLVSDEIVGLGRVVRMSVIAGIERHGGRKWIHISAARPDRLPSWDDLKQVKRVIAGPERQAIQVIPRDSEYVNFHPNCLHLFVCLDDDPIPSFAQGGML